VIVRLDLSTHPPLLTGRDTDYGRVAREFEAMVDHLIVQAVQHAAAHPPSKDVVPSSDAPLVTTATDSTPVGAKTEGATDEAAVPIIAVVP
jgi:hypothetical protein